MNLNFKTWILNESPDSVVIKEPGKGMVAALNWNTGLTFFLFNKYYIYTKKATDRSTTHNGLLTRLVGIYESVILPAYVKDISPQELNEKIKEELEVNSIGILNQKALEEIVEIASLYQRESDDEVDFLRNDFGEITDWPDIILGRIWPQNKIVSFWNRDVHVFSKSSQIIEFVGNWGNPSEFKYEIVSRNDLNDYQLYDYEHFSQHSKEWTRPSSFASLVNKPLKMQNSAPSPIKGKP